MDSSSTPSLNKLHWEEVLPPAGKIGSESLYLNRLLQYLCQENALSGAALYIETDEGFRRQASCGRDDYPMMLAADAEPPDPHFKLPAGLLVYASEASAPVDLSGSWALALTSAQQATVLGRHLKQQSFVVNYRGVELEALYDVGLAIASMLNLEGLGEEALLRAVSLLDARRGALYLRDGKRFVLDHTFGGEAAAELPLDDPQIQRLLEDRLQGKQDLLPEAKFLMALPIGTSRDPQGLLLVGDKESRQGVGKFKDSDRRTLALFANQVAIAIETAHLHRQALEKERLERELDLAADIQRGLLPDELPHIEGYELAGWSRSARHVGGDYYDLLSLRDGRMAAVLADVSGKGMPAALLVSTIHSAVRLLIRQNEVGPKLIEDLNQHVSESSATNRFITLFVAELDSQRNRIDYVNAGHNPALMIRASGKVELLHSGGLPVGLFETSSYQPGSVTVDRGDLLCAYSDGITECLSPAEEEYGLNRLTQLISGMQGKPLEEIVSAVSRDVTKYAGGHAQGDDQTLLFLRRKT